MLRTSLPRAALLTLLALLALAGCAATAEDLEEYEQSAQFATVSSLRGRAGCSTAGVEGLSAQLLDEMVCLAEGRLVRFAPRTNITLTSTRVHPLLSPAARDGLWRAAARVSIRVNSGFRTLAEQYVLYYSAGCGLVARPGSSNHETGRAIDVDNYGSANSALTSNGFAHPYPSSDPVHYDGPGSDFRALSVRAFQRLWNANNPGDRIAEDGAAGPATLDRLGRTQTTGFRVGRVCGMTTATPRLRAEFVAQSFPTARTAIELAPGATLAGYIEMRNTGTVTWMPGATFLATTEERDRASALAGADWVRPNRPATVDRPVPPGMTGRFNFTLLAPATLGEYAEYFGLVHEGVGWFSDTGQGGPPDDQLQIRVRVGRAPYAAEVVSVSFASPLTLEPGEEREGTVEVRNTGAQAWMPDATFLGTTQPRDRASEIAGTGWVRPERVATVARAVASGETYTFTFRVRAPQIPGEYVESFNLVQEGVAWFSDMGQGGPDDDAITLRVVVPGAQGDGGATSDGGVTRRDAGTGVDGGRRTEPMAGCGCATAGHHGAPGARVASALIALLAASLASARRRCRRNTR